MSQFYCIHCGQPIVAHDLAGGLEVPCPRCYKSVRVPGLLPSRYRTHRTWPLVGFVTLVGLGVAAVCYFMRRETPLETDSVISLKILSGILVPVLMALIPALLLAVVAASIATLADRSFQRISGLVYSIVFLPLILWALFEKTLTGENHLQKLIQKAPSVQIPWKEAFEKISQSLNPKPIPSAAEIEAALDGVREDARKLMSTLHDDEGLPQPVTSPFSPTPPPTNEADKFRLFIQSFFTDMINLQNQYLKELDEAGISTLLSPERVAKDTDFQESDAMMVEILRVVKNCRERADQLVVGFPERIENSDFSRAFKASLKQGFQHGVQKSMPLFKENWELEFEAVQLMGDILRLLKTSREDWSVENGQFLFQTQANLDRFNELMTDINLCVERQAEIRQKQMQAAEAAMEKL